MFLLRNLHSNKNKKTSTSSRYQAALSSADTNNPVCQPDASLCCGGKSSGLHNYTRSHSQVALAGQPALPCPVNVSAEECLMRAVQGHRHTSRKSQAVRETDNLQTSLHNVSIIGITSDKKINSMGKMRTSFWLQTEFCVCLSVHFSRYVKTHSLIIPFNFSRQAARD